MNKEKDYLTIQILNQIRLATPFDGETINTIFDDVKSIDKTLEILEWSEKTDLNPYDYLSNLKALESSKPQTPISEEGKNSV